MIMADVFKIVFLVLGTLIVFVSYWLVAAALLPRVVDRARARYDAHPVRATLVGALVAVPGLTLGGALLTQAANPAAKLLGGGIVSLVVLLAFLGSAGLADRIGAGLPAAGDDAYRWRRVLRGGTVLSFTFLLPVVGWFAVLPGTLLSGIGVAIGALRESRREQRARTAAPVEAISPLPTPPAAERTPTPVPRSAAGTA
jgi:hypothetical protein